MKKFLFKIWILVLVAFGVGLAMYLYKQGPQFQNQPAEVAVVLEEDVIEAPVVEDRPVQIVTTLSENDKIAAITDEICKGDADCMLPFEYAILSHCPYTSKCVDNVCMIICPEFPQQYDELVPLDIKIETPEIEEVEEEIVEEDIFEEVSAYPSEMNAIANGEWETYRSEKYGVEFGYPAEFEIAEEIHVTYENGTDWYRIWVKNPNVKENPAMLLEINPDGYGPFFPDLNYNLTESTDQGIELLEENMYEPNEYNQDELMFIVAGIFSKTNKNTYSWHFTYNEEGEDYSILFKDILATYKFF